MWSGFQGAGSKTIIPAHAHAKVSCRLVAAQDPTDIFEKFRDFVLAVAPPGVKVSVESLGGGRPSLTAIDHPVTRAAARALEATFGRAPLYTREGGSIPVAASFESILGLPVVLLGFVQPHENAHAPDEWMDLANYEGAIRAIVATFDEIGALGAGLPDSTSGWVNSGSAGVRYGGRTAAKATPCLRGGHPRVTIKTDPTTVPSSTSGWHLETA